MGFFTQIKEKLVGKQASTVQTSTQTASGTTSNLVSLSNFSNTADRKSVV